MADTATMAGLFEALPHDVALLDDEGNLVAANQRWLAASLDPVLNRSIGANLLAHLRAVPSQHAAIGEHLADGLGRVLSGRSPRFELQYEIRHGDTPHWYLLACASLPGGRAVVTHTDTTIHHSVQDVLADMAFHDTLTGLPNRALVLDRIRMALIRAQRTGTVAAIFFIDLDGFKAVNDAHGHEVGDRVLVKASERLTTSVREGDTCGRWGGDEFVLVIDLADSSVIGNLIDRAQRAFEEPIVVDGLSISVGLSIGVVLCRPNDEISDLIRLADSAMYEAKRTGQGVRIICGDGGEPPIVLP